MSLKESGKIQLGSIGSPSLMYHNLSFLVSGICVYATDDGVGSCHVSSGNVSLFLSMKSPPITSIKGIPPANGFPYVSAAIFSTASDIYVVSEKGVLSTCHLEIGTDGLVNSCSASCDSGNTALLHVMAGTSSGKVLFYQLTVNSTAVSMIPQPSTGSHSFSVTAVATRTFFKKDEPNLIFAISGDSSGNIFVWGHAYQQLLSIPSPAPDTVTDLAVLDSGERLVSSYGSGKIRVYSLKGNCEVEVFAHAKWINSIAYQSPFLASVSEDGVLNVWNVDEKSNKVITFKGNSAVANDGLATGVTFDKAGDVLVASYSNPCIRVYSLR